MAGRGVTRNSRKSVPRTRGTPPLFRMVEWNAEQARNREGEAAREAATALPFAVPPSDGTARNKLTVPLFHPPIRGGTRGTRNANRWRIVVELLRSPERETRRLVALLERLPAMRLVHHIGDKQPEGWPSWPEVARWHEARREAAQATQGAGRAPTVPARAARTRGRPQGKATPGGRANVQ